MVSNDLGFVACRLGMGLPVLVQSWASAGGDSSAAVIGGFAKAYFIALFISNVALFGAHERYLIAPRRAGLLAVWQVLLRCVAMGVVWAIATTLSGVTPDPTVWLYVVAARVLPFYYFTVTRSRPKDYLTVFAAYAATLCLTVVTANQLLISMVPVLLGCGWVAARVGQTLPATARLALRTNSQELRRSWPYFVNHLAVSTFLQGTLAFYACLVGEAEFGVISLWVNLTQIGLVLQGLLYRIMLTKLASGLIDPGAMVRNGLLACFAIGVAWSVLILGAGDQIEWLLFGDTYLTQTQRVLAAVLVPLHSLNFVWSSLLIGSGAIAIQSRIAVCSGVLTLTLVAALHFAGVPNTAPIAMLLSSLVITCVRASIGLRLLQSGAPTRRAATTTSTTAGA